MFKNWKTYSIAIKVVIIAEIFLMIGVITLLFCLYAEASQRKEITHIDNNFINFHKDNFMELNKGSLPINECKTVISTVKVDSEKDDITIKFLYSGNTQEDDVIFADRIADFFINGKGESVTGTNWWNNISNNCKNNYCIMITERCTNIEDGEFVYKIRFEEVK